MFSSNHLYLWFLKNHYLLFSSGPVSRHLGSCKHYVKVLGGENRLTYKKPMPRTRKLGGKNKQWTRRDYVGSTTYMRDVISRICNVLRYSPWDSAKEQLENLPIKWDSYTINQVLKMHPPMEKAWMFFDWTSRLKGFKHDQFTFTTMMDIFGEAGRISSMKYVYKQMQEKGIRIDVVTCTSLLHWLSKDGDIDGSVKIWREMKENGFQPTVVSYTAYMKVLFDHKRVKEATEIYKEMLDSGCAPNCHTYTVLMEHLAISGKYKAVLEVFLKMQEAGVHPDKATCNILIENCCRAGLTWLMTPILQYMKKSSLALRYTVYVNALETLETAGESDLLLRQANPQFSIGSYMKKEALSFQDTSGDSKNTLDRELVLLLLKKQNLVALDWLLSCMIDKDARLHPGLISSIIKLNCNQSRTSGAELALEYSVRMGIDISRSTYLSLVGFFIRMNSIPKVVYVVEKMLAVGISVGVYQAAQLLYRIGCAKRPALAAKIFDMLSPKEKNSATFTALISAYFMCGRIDKGLKVYDTMRSKEIRPVLGTYNVLLAGLIKASRDQEAVIFRKEKKTLQTSMHSERLVSLEEKICDLLFAGYSIP